MKAIIQRVLNASVLVGGKTISSIDRGLLVLIGISRDDTQADADYMYVYPCCFLFLPSSTLSVYARCMLHTARTLAATVSVRSCKRAFLSQKKASHGRGG